MIENEPFNEYVNDDLNLNFVFVFYSLIHDFVTVDVGKKKFYDIISCIVLSDIANFEPSLRIVIKK